MSGDPAGEQGNPGGWGWGSLGRIASTVMSQVQETTAQFGPISSLALPETAIQWKISFIYLYVLSFPFSFASVSSLVGTIAVCPLGLFFPSKRGNLISPQKENLYSTLLFHFPRLCDCLHPDVDTSQSLVAFTHCPDLFLQCLACLTSYFLSQ